MGIGYNTYVGAQILKLKLNLEFCVGCLEKKD